MVVPLPTSHFWKWRLIITSHCSISSKVKTTIFKLGRFLSGFLQNTFQEIFDGLRWNRASSEFIFPVDLQAEMITTVLNLSCEINQLINNWMSDSDGLIAGFYLVDRG
jgi:hypothetical protein